MRVLIFGDSITLGCWDHEGGWVQRLVKVYMDRRIEDLDRSQPVIFNLGVDGDKSDKLLKRFENEVEARKWPNEEFFFVLAVGINNSYQKNEKFYSTPAEFTRDMRRLIVLAKNYTDKILVVGLTSVDEARTTPVSWDNIHWTNDRIARFDTCLQAVCSEKNIQFVSIFDTFKADQQEKNLLIDGLHPNDAGHELIAGLVKPELEKQLQ